VFAGLLQEPNVSLIITDYWMPEMTGYELLKKVKVRTTSILFFQTRDLQYLPAKKRDLQYRAHILSCIANGTVTCMQESSRLKEIPVVIMSSENVPNTINRSVCCLLVWDTHAQTLKLFTPLLHFVFRFLTCVVFTTRCLEEGAEDFLLKPVRASDVSRLCSRVLRWAWVDGGGDEHMSILGCMEKQRRQQQ
jgi:CheY-like chemotaxis protein